MQFTQFSLREAMLYIRKLQTALPTAVGAGIMLASSAAMATPMINLEITDTDSGASQTFSSGTGSGSTQDLVVNDNDIFGYDLLVSVDADDFTRTDQLIETNITAEAADSTPTGRLEFDLQASNFTGFSGNTRVSTITTPSLVSADLDVESSVNGTTILDEENLSAGSTVTSSQPVPMSSPYTIQHLSQIELGQGETSFDTSTTVPAPATLGLMGAALIGLGVAARRRRDVGV